MPFQVSAFFADYGLEKRGRHLPLYQHYKRNIKTIVKDLVVSSSLIIPPNKTKSFSCSLHIPKLPPSTCDSHLICVSSCSNRLHEGQFLLDIDDHLIKLKYFCRVTADQSIVLICLLPTPSKLSVQSVQLFILSCTFVVKSGSNGVVKINRDGKTQLEVQLI